jgi:hypothetical protein
MLSQYEINKIIEALGHAERNSHASNKQAWRNVADKVRKELTPASGGSCSCEDRPCCSCDGDVYQPAGSIYDLNDPNNYDPEEHFARMEQQSGDDYCTKCGEEWTDEDNEDDVVQGFHSACAEDGE